MTEGFYWARRKSDASLTVVQVTEGSPEPGVMFIGNLNWPDLSEAQELIEILGRIPEPA